MDWAILYEDGSWFTSKDGPPEAAPTEGVLVIEQSGHNDSPLQNCDHYIWRTDEGCWLPIMHDGIVAQFRRYAPRITACVDGVTVSYDKWCRIAKKRVSHLSDRRYEVG